MAFDPTNLQFRLSNKSGSAGNTLASTPANSLGKYVAVTNIVNDANGNLHTLVTQARVDRQAAIYRALFIYNADDESTGALKVWIAGEGYGGALPFIAWDTTVNRQVGASSAQALEVATDEDAPAGLTFERPMTEAQALTNPGGPIAAGFVHALWVKLQARPDYGALQDDYVVLHFADSAGAVWSKEIRLVWDTQPSAERVDKVLSGDFGVVSMAYRYERVDIGGGFLSDVTDLFYGGSIELNNDREVLRTGTFSARADESRLNILSDFIALVAVVQVDEYPWEEPQGLYRLSFPVENVGEVATLWELKAADLTLHLIGETLSAPLTLAAGLNVMTGTGCVQDLLEDRGLRHALPDTDRVLPRDTTWDAGTSILTLVNDLLHVGNFYSIWADRHGIFTTRVRGSMGDATAVRGFNEGPNSKVVGNVQVESEDTRLANQIVAIVDSPEQQLSAVVTNESPDSPTSTKVLHRTITKQVRRKAIADQAALEEFAWSQLEQSQALYKRVTLRTLADPRADAREIYFLNLPGLDGNWQCRNWRLDLRSNEMVHTLGKVQKVR